MTFPAGDRGAVTADGFARLLARLHPDAEQGGLEYERLRRSLVKFFDWRGVWPPDECADEVMDRLVRKLDDVAVHDVRKYVYGIARLVALERRRVPALAPLDDVPEAAASTPAASEPGAASVHDCFDRCLAELPEDSRSILLQYYEGERGAKISNRRRLAFQLGVSENALRSRVQRLRDRLESCMLACSSQPVRQAP